MLMETGLFDSANLLLNKILKGGIDKFVKLYLGNDTRSFEKSNDAKDESANKILQSIGSTLDEMFVVMNLVETLVTILYNVQIMECDGNRVTREAMESGIMSSLPEGLQNVKNEIVGLIKQAHTIDIAIENKC